MTAVSHEAFPPDGEALQIAFEGALIEMLEARGPGLCGVLLDGAGRMILGLGPRAVALRFSTSEDVLRLLIGLGALASHMARGEGIVAQKADAQLARILEERTGNA